MCSTEAQIFPPTTTTSSTQESSFEKDVRALGHLGSGLFWYLSTLNIILRSLSFLHVRLNNSSHFCAPFLSGFTSGQVTHPKIWTLAKTGRTARIDCVVDASDGSFSLSSTALHWYKWKDGEAPTRLLHFPAGSNSAQKEDSAAGLKITADKKGQKSTLTFSASSAADRANYCCAVWRSDDTVLSFKGSSDKICHCSIMW